MPPPLVTGAPSLCSRMMPLRVATLLGIRSGGSIFRPQSNPVTLAFEEFRLAITEERHGAAIAAFLQGQQRAHAFVRCATDHIDEHDIRVLIIDHPQQSRAVRELDDIDGLPPELFAELLAQTKILINDEA